MESPRFLESADDFRFDIGDLTRRLTDKELYHRYVFTPMMVGEPIAARAFVVYQTIALSQHICALIQLEVLRLKIV